MSKTPHALNREASDGLALVALGLVIACLAVWLGLMAGWL